MSNSYQIILDNIEDLAWLVNSSGEFVVVNQAFLTLYQCKTEQVIGKTYYDLVDKKTADQYSKEDQEVIASLKAKLVECNVEFTDKDGWIESEWLETQLTPAFSPDQPETCIGVIGISRDITERKQKQQQLEEQQEWLKLYFDLPLIGMAVLDENLSWLNCNQKLCDILAYAESDLMQTKLSTLILERYQQEFTRLIEDLNSENKTFSSIELEMFQKEKQAIFIQLVIRRIEVKNSTEGYNYVVLIEDITTRKDAEQKLRLANQVIESSTEAVLITNENKEIIRVNSAFSTLTGYDEQEVLGKNPNMLNSGRNPQELYRTMWNSIDNQGHWQGEIWDRRKDGSTFPKWLNISAIYRDDSKDISHYVALFSDITEQKKVENKIKYMAYHDALTGLPNKTLLESRLIRSIIEAEEEQTQLALIQLDLDNFKTINDSMGHYVGDELLKEVGKVLKKCFRTTDLIARVGGDEFMIMIDKLNDCESVKSLAENILKTFSQPLNVLGYTMHVSTSIGICLYPENGENHESLLQNVDTALHNAKKQGKNRYTFFSQDMSKQVLKRIKTEYQMRGGIKEQEFTVYYQPQVDLQTQHIAGVEALIRWPGHPEHLSPVDFIPVAEETGLIRPIGEGVLEQSCRDCMVWHEQGFPINVAVNLSAQQFDRSYLLQLINRVLTNTQLPAQFLDLEITETMLMTDSNTAVQTLNELKKLGLKVSIDDFGTGYSSLAYLKAFNVDKLKIDRSFVIGLPNDKDDIAIAQAIIQMAKSLGMKIVAEGAETDEQFHFLRQHECDQIQGYYYAKPMPHDELLPFLAAWKDKH